MYVRPARTTARTTTHATGRTRFDESMADHQKNSHTGSRALIPTRSAVRVGGGGEGWGRRSAAPPTIASAEAESAARHAIVQRLVTVIDVRWSRPRRPRTAGGDPATTYV